MLRFCLSEINLIKITKMRSNDTGGVGRRILHQPFFPVDNSPPVAPPPETPSVVSGDFFPSISSPPPPPSASGGTFPANISSLPIPRSSNSVSPALIGVTVGLSISAVAIVVFSVFLYFRARRRRSASPNDGHRKHSLDFRSEGAPPPVPPGLPPKIPSNNSSEFLYLGTMVSSGGRRGGFDPRKTDSPDLQPLPPLLNRRDVDASSVESFYSPRQSSLGSRSGSTTAFAAVHNNAAPRRSASLSISPPVTASTNSETQTLSPPELAEQQQEEAEKSPLLSNASTSSEMSSPPESPTLSPLWTLASPPPSINKASPQSTHISNSPTQSILTNSSSSSKISYSPTAISHPPSPRPQHSTPASPLVSSRWSQQSSPEVRHFPNFTAPPPPPPPPPLPAIRRPSPDTSRRRQVESPVSATQFDPSIAESIHLTPKPKLKPLHWDKVRASSDREMVWDQLRCSSFKLNEEMIETLFVVNKPNNPTPKEPTTKLVDSSSRQDQKLLDPKKAQNIAISLRALNVTVQEVCQSLLEGNAETLGTEVLESLLRMAPTKEEEWKLRDYKDDSPCKLGHAERFLKTLIDIPFAFKRVEAMLYVANFESEVDYLNKSFQTLENACDELRNSRMFMKLLEAVLKTGNRMNVGTNRGDAHAFKLDTLLKLVDVKGTDGKTTLLHFVVQEMTRTEGARLCNDEAKCRKLGLEVVSCLSSDLANVKKAAAMDSEALSGEVSKLSIGLHSIAEFVSLNEKTGLPESSRSFSESMNRFVSAAEEEIFRVQAQESVALSLVKEITEYFHGDSAKEEAHPFRVFLVVRDFLAVLDRVCKEVGTINDRTVVTSGHRFPVPVNPMLPVPVNPMLPQIMTGFQYRRNSSSSDGESSS